MNCHRVSVARGEGFSNGFSADKSLEALTLHPTTWPIIKELTWNKPRFNRGSLVVNTHERQEMTPPPLWR